MEIRGATVEDVPAMAALELDAAYERLTGSRGRVLMVKCLN